MGGLRAFGRARRLLTVLSVASVAGLVAAGCSQSSLGSGGGKKPVTSTIKIGFIANLTGTLKEIAGNQRDGINLYLKLHNNKLGGHPVKLVTADEGDTGDTARASLSKLVKQDQVSAVLGVDQAATANLAIQFADDANVPVVGSLGSPTNKDPEGYVWNTSFRNSDFGQAMGAYVAKQVAGGPVYVMGMGNPGGHDQIKGFVDSFTQAGGVLANQDKTPQFTPFPPTDNNFQPYLSQAQQSGAKAVYVFYTGGPAIAFVKQYAQFGLRGQIPLYASGAVTEGSLLDAEGDAAEGIKNSANYAIDLDNNANRTFVSAYQKTYKTTPTAYAMTAYDSAAVLDRAIAAASQGGEVNGKTINDAIGKLGQIDSPRGPWQFSKDHSPEQKWYLRNVTSDGGKLTNVLVQELASL